MNQEETFDRIDAYLWDTLTADERTAFEKERATDTDLAAEVALRELENQAMRLKAQDDLRAKLKAFKAEAMTLEVVDKPETKIVPLSTGGRIVRFSPMRLAAAATVLLLVTFTTFYWGQSNYSDAALAEQSFDVNSSILRGGNSEPKNSLDVAADLMEKGKNTEAIALLQEAQKDSVLFENAAFMLAEAYFRTKNYDVAASVYKEIMQRSKDKTTIQRADFQQLIAQLASGKSKETVNIDLARIAADNNHAFQPQAIDLKTKMESIWKWVF